MIFKDVKKHLSEQIRMFLIFEFMVFIICYLFFRLLKSLTEYTPEYFSAKWDPRSGRKEIFLLLHTAGIYYVIYLLPFFTKESRIPLAEK